MNGLRQRVRVGPRLLLGLGIAAGLAACGPKAPAAAAASASGSAQSAATVPAASPTAPMPVPRSLSLATFCAAAAQLLGGPKPPVAVTGDLPAIATHATRYALQEAAAKGLPAADVERQTAALVKMGGARLVPQDPTDAARRKADEEARALAAQFEVQCVGTFAN